MEHFNYLIVGAGFSGAVLAERLNSLNKKILVIDKRDHIGGNCFDYFDEFNVLIHKYGPHYFRTNNEEVFNYLSKFTGWIPHEYKIRTCVNNHLYPFPINRDSLNQFFNINLKTEEESKRFINSKIIPIPNPKNAEEQILATLGRELYENFFKNYTIKQWNVSPKKLDASVTARIPIRYNNDDRYFDERIQAIPSEGYSTLFNSLLKSIEIWENTPFKKIEDDIVYDDLIYTGPIDEFFHFKYGNLQYRSLEFVHENYDQEFYQDWVQINFPNDFDYTRIVEIKHATHQKCHNTTIVKEFPRSVGEPFYPIPNQENKEIFQKYWEATKNLKNTYFMGRLGTYRYLNMDQVVGEALNLFEKLKVKG